MTIYLKVVGWERNSFLNIKSFKMALKLTKFGELYDTEGGISFPGNLLEAFSFLRDKYRKTGSLPKDLEVTFYVSVFDPEEITRGKEKRTEKINFLLKEWKLEFKKPFSFSLLEKLTKQQREKEDAQWGNYEREARKRSAWGGYVNTMHNIKLVEEEERYQLAKSKKDTKKIKEIENERKGRSSLLYIG